MAPNPAIEPQVRKIAADLHKVADDLEELFDTLKNDGAELTDLQKDGLINEVISQNLNRMLGLITRLRRV